ncbi:MAG: hypothetical protein RLZZ312_514 [Bacteroidota bacterium]|jgi:hypothetical protein
MYKNLKLVPFGSILILYLFIYKNNFINEFTKTVIVFIFAIINMFFVIYLIKSKQISPPKYILLLSILIGIVIIFIVGAKQID